MRLIVLLTLLSVISTSCSTKKSVLSKNIQVTLVDQKTNIVIDNGQVTLTSIIGNVDVIHDVKYTDTNGKCSFLFDYEEGNNYRVWAQKQGLLTYLVNDSLDVCRSDADIDESTGVDVTLYLTSDSMNHINFWAEATPRYEMAELIPLLKSNEYAETLPQLFWEDIPALLSSGMDSTLISHFPRNPVSSYYIHDCYVGIITLWFVESIRISERDRLISPVEKYPSLNPILKFENPPESTPENTVDKMNQAFEAYQLWWEEVQQLAKEDACKIDPLENSNLGWN